jgi:hypothetical protein
MLTSGCFPAHVINLWTYCEADQALRVVRSFAFLDSSVFAAVLAQIEAL